jgi:hypothetical protein
MNIIPFDGNKALPDYFQAFDLSALNSAFVTASSGFPVLSLKDKHFTVIKGGVGTMLMNPKDPESPAMSIDVVIIATNKGRQSAKPSEKSIMGHQLLWHWGNSAQANTA